MARAFNGTNQSLQSGSNVDLSATRQVSISFWLFAAAFNGSFQVICEIGNPYFSTNGLCVGVDLLGGGGKVFAGVGTASFGNFQYCTPPSVNVWHHYLIELDRDNTNGCTAIYIDGVSQSLTVGGSGNSAAAAFASAALNVASRNNASAWFACTLAELAIYPGGVLTDLEAQSGGRGNLPLLIRPGKLVRWWPLFGLQSPEVDIHPPSTDATNISMTVNGATASLHSPSDPLSQLTIGNPAFDYDPGVQANYSMHPKRQIICPPDQVIVI